MPGISFTQDIWMTFSNLFHWPLSLSSRLADSLCHIFTQINFSTESDPPSASAYVNPAPDSGSLLNSMTSVEPSQVTSIVSDLSLYWTLTHSSMDLTIHAKNICYTATPIAIVGKADLIWSFYIWRWMTLKYKNSKLFFPRDIGYERKRTQKFVTFYI